jgi:hypothetical protein
MGSEASGAAGGTDRGGSDRGSDPIGDFQRWLMRAGARSVGRDVADRVKTTLNGGRRTTGEVWEIATTEPPPDEAPECAWCPICRAARRYRESAGGSGSGTGTPAASAPAPGLGSQFAGVSETLAGLAQDAFSIFDSALRSAQRPPSRSAESRAAESRAAEPRSAEPRSAEQARQAWASATSETGAGTGWPGTASEDAVPPQASTPPQASAPVQSSVPPQASAPVRDVTSSGDAASEPGDAGSESGGAGSDDGSVVGSPVLGRPAVHPQDQEGESAHEGGDRQERGEAGDAPAQDGREDQVERPAE